MLTPDKIKEKTFQTIDNDFYRAEDVDNFLNEVSVSYEQMLKENSDLKKQTFHLSKKVEEYQTDNKSLYKISSINTNNFSGKNDLLAKIKEKSFRTMGNVFYHAEDVNNFFNEVSVSYEQLFKENGEFIKKIATLVKKIEEYKTTKEKLEIITLFAKEIDEYRTTKEKLEIITLFAKEIDEYRTTKEKFEITPFNRKCYFCGERQDKLTACLSCGFDYTGKKNFFVFPIDEELFSRNICYTELPKGLFKKYIKGLYDIVSKKSIHSHSQIKISETEMEEFANKLLLFNYGVDLERIKNDMCILFDVRLYGDGSVSIVNQSEITYSTYIKRLAILCMIEETIPSNYSLNYFVEHNKLIKAKSLDLNVVKRDIYKILNDIYDFTRTNYNNVKQQSANKDIRRLMDWCNQYERIPDDDIIIRKFFNLNPSRLISVSQIKRELFKLFISSDEIMEKWCIQFLWGASNSSLDSESVIGIEVYKKLEKLYFTLKTIPSDKQLTWFLKENDLQEKGIDIEMLKQSLVRIIIENRNIF